MISLGLLLMILVVVFFACAAFTMPVPHPRLSWLGLGLFTWALKVLLIGAGA